jgi:hypothetical protein
MVENMPLDELNFFFKTYAEKAAVDSMFDEQYTEFTVRCLTHTEMPKVLAPDLTEYPAPDHMSISSELMWISAMYRPGYIATYNTGKSFYDLDEILYAVCDLHKTDPYTIFKRTRLREISLKRQEFFYMAAKYSGITLEKIGEYAGAFVDSVYDHATVLNGRRRISGFLETPGSYDIKSDIAQLKDKLKIFDK